eukprot:COSAG06_NODE_31739_length_516_cov_1.232614_1_plen_142_part_10
MQVAILRAQLEKEGNPARGGRPARAVPWPRICMAAARRGAMAPTWAETNKSVRKLRKRLRQIQHLKQRAEERELTEEEQAKVDDEPSTRSTLAEEEALFATLEPPPPPLLRRSRGEWDRFGRLVVVVVGRRIIKLIVEALAA